MWGAASDIQPSCWRMVQFTPVAAMTLGSWGMRSPEKNQVKFFFVCLFVLMLTPGKIHHPLNISLCCLSEHVVALDAQIIVALSCGESHTLALNDKGQMFSWGLGSDGQLGLNNFEECVRVPRYIQHYTDLLEIFLVCFVEYTVCSCCPT